MTQHCASRCGRAMALVETVAGLAIVAVLCAGLATGAARARKDSRLAGSIDNLRFFASGTQSYAADHANKFWSYSWRAGQQQTEFTDLQFASTDLDAAVNQAIHILRRQGITPQITRSLGWFPHARFNYLPLMEHTGTALPSRVAVSPEDRLGLAWQRSASEFLAMTARPTAEPNAALRWMYSTSYDLGPAFYSPDAASLQSQTVHQAQYHYVYQLPGSLSLLGHRRLDEVRYPANKAHMWDMHQRDLGEKQPFFSMPGARVPVLCVDGSAGLRAAESTNRGFNPSTPLNPNPTTFLYQPDPAWEPPTQNGMASQTVIGGMRYTRWGLRGRDFNGPEVFNP